MIPISATYVRGRFLVRLYCTSKYAAPYCIGFINFAYATYDQSMFPIVRPKCTVDSFNEVAILWIEDVTGCQYLQSLVTEVIAAGSAGRYSYRLVGPMFLHHPGIRRGTQLAVQLAARAADERTFHVKSISESAVWAMLLSGRPRLAEARPRVKCTL